eukprot:1158735-Pelagomonas_calceolata.AAC.6
MPGDIPGGICIAAGHDLSNGAPGGSAEHGLPEAPMQGMILSLHAPLALDVEAPRQAYEGLLCKSARKYA